MRRIITMTIMALGLSGGAAMADTYRGHETVSVRDHRGTRENRETVVRYDNVRARPAARFERHEERRGFGWRGGDWRWSGATWSWAPGHYFRR
jgi:hypothetical protein